MSKEAVMVDHYANLCKLNRALARLAAHDGAAAVNEYCNDSSGFTVTTLADGELQISKRVSAKLGQTKTHEFREVGGLYKWVPKQPRDGAGRHGRK